MLHEQADAPTPRLTHRDYGKALLLPLDVCSVYCRFCTCGYAIGGDIHSFEHYDRITGICVYRSPAVHADLVYLYFDPVNLLPK